jgi:hypothetical protein
MVVEFRIKTLYPKRTNMANEKLWWSFCGNGYRFLFMIKNLDLTHIGFALYNFGAHHLRNFRCFSTGAAGVSF